MKALGEGCSFRLLMLKSLVHMVESLQLLLECQKVGYSLTSFNCTPCTRSSFRNCHQIVFEADNAMIVVVCVKDFWQLADTSVNFTMKHDSETSGLWFLFSNFFIVKLRDVQMCGCDVCDRQCKCKRCEC